MTLARSKSSGASFLRISIMKRTASTPTSSTTSRNVTKSPERFDIFTGSPARISRTSWHSRTSSVAPDVDEAQKTAIDLALVIGDVGRKIGIAAVRFDQRAIDVVAELGRAKQ